jgi:hypothetical protein
MLQDVQRAVRPDTTPWEGLFIKWLGTDKLRHVVLEFPEDKLEITSVTMILGVKDRDVYLAAMRPVCN